MDRSRSPRLSPSTREPARALPLARFPLIPAVQLIPAVLLVLGGLLVLPALASAQDGERGERRPRTLTIPPVGAPPPAEAAPGETVEEPAEESRRRPSRRQQARDRDAQLLTGYREVLDLLAQGRRAEAADRLFAAEKEALGEGDLRTMEQVFQSQVEVVAWLSKQDLEALVPLMILHHDGYRRAVTRGEPHMAGHAARITASLADLYAREGGTEGSRVLGARVLASLGLHGQEVGVKLRSLAFMLRALEYDPRNAVALLGLATAHERSGGYEDARRYLLQLLEAQPSHREGRLRLSVIDARQGSPEAARQRLRGLVDEERSDWVAVVAVEELARLHLAAGDPATAAAILERGLSRMPDEERIRTQLALALDRAGKPLEARRVLERLPRSVIGSYRPTPRRLYGLGPQESRDRLREDLEQGSESRVPRLAAVLEADRARREASR